MGCEVVSVYNDEVIGKIGFSKQIIEDLVVRDYRQLKQIKDCKILVQKINRIYGFTQSYATARLFFVMINKIQNAVYVAGRFIVIRQVQSQKQKIIANKDYIASFMVSDKLCLVGLIGGTVLLWDLQFLQIKLQILLPQQSSTISTVGLTSKYIFVTDSSSPNNIAYCYDLRTAQLLTHSKIPSFQPAVKCITFNQNLHATACADGVWFIKMLRNDKELEIVRGMFGRYPKTSMTCIDRVKDYVVTGGVDGYVYVWRVSNYRCCKALRVADCEITSIGVRDKYVIFGCGDNRVKAYTFEITKKEKKEFEGGQSDKYEDDEEDQMVAFIMVDSYSKEGEVIATAVSLMNPLLYYCQTRQGLFFQQWLPAPTAERKKINIHLDYNQTMQRINCRGIMVNQGSKLYSAYKGGKSLIFVDIFQIQENGPKIVEERIVILKEDCLNIIGYCINSQQIAYVTLNNILQVSSTFNKKGQAVSQESKSDFGLYMKIISDIGNEKVISLNFISTNKSLLCLTTNQSILVYQRIAMLNYQQKCHIKYEKKIPPSIKLQSQQLIYQQQCERWKEKDSKYKPLSHQLIKQHQLIHSSKINSLDNSWGKLSCGGGFAIAWR